MIIRVKHERNYTVVDNQCVRDPRLSFRASGILVYLLSLPDGADISGLRLADAKTEGRDAVYAALKELEQVGYLLRRRAQDERGRWFHVCLLAESNVLPGNPQPITGFQEPVDQYSVKQASNKEVLSTSTKSSDDFWKAETATEKPISPEAREDALAKLRALREGVVW